jgi:multidrug efflux system outer membrane protein
VSKGAPLAGWWRRFDDPLLSRLIDDALLHNTSVQGAQAALRQARALRDVAAAGALPSLGGTVGATCAQQWRHEQPLPGRPRRQLGADVFGGTRAAIDAATATVGSRAASLGDVQVSISAELALAYIDLRSTQARRAIADANLASQLETLQIAQWRQQAGLVTVLDVEQARGAVETLRAQLPALQTQAEQDAHAIAVLSGRPPADLLQHLSRPGAAAAARRRPGPEPAGRHLAPAPRRAGRRAAGAGAQGRVAQADAARYPSFTWAARWA